MISEPNFSNYLIELGKENDNAFAAATIIAMISFTPVIIFIVLSGG